MLFLIRELKFNVSVNMSGSGTVGLGVGVGSFQLGVYMPLKALFLVFMGKPEKSGEMLKTNPLLMVLMDLNPPSRNHGSAPVACLQMQIKF